MPRIFAALILGSLVLLLSISQTLADEDLELPSISVTGTAVTRVTPDTIVWSITTTDEDRLLKSAKQASDVASNRVSSLRDKLQLESDQLTSGRLQIEKIYNRDQFRNRTSFKHFQVQRQFTLRQHDLTKFDEFLTQIVGGPVEASFVFESSKIYELKDETRIKAIGLARKKAAAMANALGAEIGKPIKISEVTSGPYQPNFGENAMFNGSFQAPSDDAGGADGASGAIVPDAIEVTISVHITFELK